MGTLRGLRRARRAGWLHPRLTAPVRVSRHPPQETHAMAGNAPATPHTDNASPRPDRGPPGMPRADDNTSGYDEPKATTTPREMRDAPDPTIAGNQPAQAGTTPAPQDPDAPDIDQPIPPGDIPSKTPVQEPERGEAQYVDRDPADDPQAIYSDAARPVVPGPGDGAD
jgi:hypothetical protein